MLFYSAAILALVEIWALNLCCVAPLASFSFAHTMTKKCGSHTTKNVSSGATEEEAQTKKATSTRGAGKERAAATDGLDNVTCVLKKVLE